MNPILNALNAVPGVIGSLIFDDANECVAEQIPPPYEPVLLQGVVAELREAAGMLATLDDAPWEVFTLHFDGGYLFVRQHAPYTLLVLADSAANPAMLNVGLNVATMKLAKLGQAAAAPATRASSPPLPQPPPQPPPAPSTTAASRSGISGPAPGFGASVPRFSMSGGAHEYAPDAVPRAAMDGLLRALALQVGPFAKIFMRDDVVKLGATISTLGLGQYDDYVRLLALRVPDGTKRDAFLREAARVSSAR